MRKIKMPWRSAPANTTPQTNTLGVPSSVSPKSPNKKRKIIILSIAGTILLISIVATIYFLIRSNDSNDNLTGIAGEYQKQLPELKKKVEDNPKDATARKDYAVALYATQNYQAAKTQYEEAVKLNDKDAIAYNNLANTYRDLNQTDKAIEAYRKAIQLDPKSINTYANLANVQLYAEQDADAAIATYKQGLEALPNNVQLQILLGIAYETAGKTSEAKATYENILKSDPDNATAKTNLEKLQ